MAAWDITSAPGGRGAPGCATPSTRIARKACSMPTSRAAGLVHILRGQEDVLFEAEPGKHTENEMAHFLDCIETGQTPLTDGRSSLQACA